MACGKVKLFENYKKELECSLKEANLEQLCQRFHRGAIISKYWKDKFLSLDTSHLHSDIRVRYLLKEVYENMKRDEKVYDQLVEILISVGGSVKDVCVAMKKELSGIRDVGGLELPSSGNLEEKHVPLLVKGMVSGSHKWEEIAIALGLPKHVRIECGSSGSNVVKLTNILTTWILDNKECYKTATVGNLRAALASEIVGLSGIAQKLDMHEDWECLPESNKARFDTGLEITFQSSDTEVADSWSTVVEVQVQPDGCECYQWYKDDQPLHEGAKFSGVSSNMLFINRAKQGTEGKYCCCVSKDNECYRSDEIQLKVVYSPEKESLVDFYTIVEADLLKNVWPPRQNKFINLALIKQGSTNESTYFTIRGDMDDILESKEEVKYEEVFESYRIGSLVLIEGRPGSGKTTLVHKISKDWAKTGEVLEGANMVFLVSLRLLSSSGRDRKLSDILEVFYGPDLRKKVERRLQNSLGKGACFIIDGLDEYQPSSGIEKSIIYQLINKTCLPLSMVIVASRPVATQTLRTSSSMRIEVIGFTRQQIYKYVEQYPYDIAGSTNVGSELKIFLDQHVNVLHMCYLPVHAAMICFLYSDLKGHIPHTETQIYEQLTISTIIRQTCRSKDMCRLESLKELRGEEKVVFNKVCELAFYMTENSKQVIGKNEVKISLSDGRYYDLAGLGLVTVERTCDRYGIKDMYSFFHLTFQEFLAAYYFSELEEHACINLLQKWENMDWISFSRYKNMCKFICGLVTFVKDSHSLSVLMSSIQKQGSLFCIQCAFESQQTVMCDCIISQGEIIFDPQFLVPDYFSLSYVISTASQLVLKLKIVTSALTDAASSFLSNVNREKMKNIKFLFYEPLRSLEIHSLILPDSYKELNVLNSLLCMMPLLENVSLKGFTLDKIAIRNLTKNIVLPHLKVLDLNLNISNYQVLDSFKLLKFRSPNVQKVYWNPSKYSGSEFSLNLLNWNSLKKLLSFSFGFIESELLWVHLNSDSFSCFNASQLSHCTEVVLVNCSVNDDAVKVLTGSLNSSILERVVLDFNIVSDLGAQVLSNCFSNCSKLREVSLQFTSIGDSGTVALANVLAVRSQNLRKLNLQGNHISDEGAVAIARAAKTLPQLTLHLCNVNISEEGVRTVLKLKPNAGIREMVFTSSWDCIDKASIEDQRRAYKCGIIPTLKATRNNAAALESLITDSRIGSIKGLSCDFCLNVTLLQSMKNLQELTVAYIYPSQILTFVDCLEHCEQLHKISISDVCESLPILINILTNLKDLQTLKLIRCTLNSKDLALLFGDPTKWSNLKVLDLSRDGISSEGIAILNEMFRHCKTLHSLILSYNHIEDSDIVVLAEGLKNITTLQELGLQGNKINSDGATALTSVFSSNHLQCVDLSRCSISSDLAPSLVETVCSEALATLNLSNNNLGSEGAASLSVGLRCCSHLVHLDISRNNIGSHGVSSLAEGLQYCINLKRLFMRINYITSASVDAVINVMGSCSELMELDLRGNNIDMKGMTALIRGWSHQAELKLELFGGGQCHIPEEKHCDDCDQLLTVYYSKDYVIIPDLSKCIFTK